MTGTKTEREFREELESSHEFHFASYENSNLRKVLENENEDISKAYILHWIPEQAEDIFVVLVNGASLINVEIDRLDNTVPPIIERESLKQYKLGLTKINQIRLQVAQELVKNKT